MHERPVVNSSMYNPSLAGHIDSHSSHEIVCCCGTNQTFWGFHDESTRPGPTTTQDKGRYGQCGCSCTVLLYDTRFVQSFPNSLPMVSLTWCQRGGKTMAGCSCHRSLHPVLVSSSRDVFVECHCHDDGGCQGRQSDHLTDESSVVATIQMVGTATSVDRPTTEMVVRTLGRCVGIFVVHPDGPIFLRAGRRPYQRSLPTRHTFPPPQTHFTSQTYA